MGNEKEEQAKSNQLVPTLLIILVFIALGIFCELALILHDRVSAKAARSDGDEARSVIDEFQTRDGIDYAVPTERGVPIATPAGEMTNYSPDSKRIKDEFRGNIEKLRKKGDEKSAALLLKRDAFAARRLRLLRELERARTPEERDALLEKLKNVSRRAAP